MACMHKETFKMYHNDQNIVPDGYVEIDELIAPTIQVLNQKGYITRFCCSGHPLDDWLMVEPGAQYRKATMAPLVESYIMFEEGITLPVLPPDFVATQNIANSRLVIRKSYYIDSAFDNQFYEKLQNIIETMKQLYKWALDLPDFETNDS